MKINNGIKYKQYGDFYKYIDEAIARHVQPLTPSANECRLEKKYLKHKKGITNNSIQKVLNKIEQKIDISKNLKYAVKMNKNLRIMDSIEEAKAFQDGLTFMGSINTELVKITYEVIYE